MKKISLFIVILFFIGNFLFSQVIVSADGSVPDNSAMLDVTSPNKGLLLPRVALTAINDSNTVVLPAIGLRVYNTATAGPSPYNVFPGNYFWNGSRWIPISPPPGVNIGDMLYWNGAQWIGVPVGTNGQVLTLNNGVPAWGGTQLPIVTTTITGITGHSAQGGGLVLCYGGLSVTAGICWSTSPNPTTANNKIIAGSGPGGTYSGILSGLSPNTLYYARAYAINSAGTAYGNQLSFTTLLFDIGQSYGGGIIFYVDNSGHALISAATDQATGAYWGCPGTLIGGTGTSIDMGQTNTTAIVNGCSTSGIAARICDDLVLNGYNDWFLPSKDELYRMYQNRTLIGGFANSYYWSSSEDDASRAWMQGFENGYQGSDLKNYNPYHVRAIRAFYSLPVVTTTPVINISQTTATSGGNITSDGGATVTARGVCWSTSSNPTTANSKTTDGTGTGIFVSNLTGLTLNTVYFVRAYATNSFGTGYGNELSFTAQFCTSPLTINHVADSIAPVTKTINYGVATNIPGETSKCWITSNLGADHQATAVNDATEASAGWYWQFNRKQGYKHDGTTRTPNTTWITTISENSDWTTANDPCNIELGTAWRIPTYTEWFNVDNNGSWTSWNGPWGSALKIHAAGYLNSNNGTLGNRGVYGDYWGSTQNSVTNGNLLTFGNVSSAMAFYDKAFGFSVRCLRE